MPIITFEAGKLTREQKKELIAKFTETASEVTKIPKQHFIVSIREMPLENVGVGGITVEEMKQGKQ
ncbi:MAG: tautomerase family protein [Nitrospirae bacterium]|nr:tautomerase family protein [Nitrospirota bacterium]